MLRDESRRVEVLGLLVEYGIYTLSRTHRDDLADRYLEIWTETDLKSIKESFALVAEHCQRYSTEKIQGYLAMILIDPARCAEAVIDIKLHNKGHYVASRHVGPEVVHGEAIRRENMAEIKRLDDVWEKEQQAKKAGQIPEPIKIVMPWDRRKVTL
jgi:hypothetical protein